MIREMIYKEEHILFPMSLETLTEREWRGVREGECEIGYAWIEPPATPDEDETEPGQVAPQGLPLDTGQLTVEQINLVLTHLPLDLTYVDENNEVRYYSQGKERIFPRSPGVIGRLVQNCHPPKSVHVVNKIVEEFKAGTKDVAEFWIPMEDKLVHIRYLAVRNGQGDYRGVLEMSQDVTEIRALKGAKRLLDWT
jgi:DUF438 domain-containing protein